MHDASIRTAENQLANSFIMAHDILCSLGVQDRLCVLGAIQMEHDFVTYMSFSTSQTDEDGKKYVDQVYILRVGQSFLNEYRGCLDCLRFVELAKEYGMGTFTDIVGAALAK